MLIGIADLCTLRPLLVVFRVVVHSFIKSIDYDISIKGSRRSEYGKFFLRVAVVVVHINLIV